MLKKSQILLIFVLLLSIEFFSISAESQVQIEDLKIYPINESLKNIVILIDISESTFLKEEGAEYAFSELIDANAIGIIRDLGHCSSAGIVTFGGETRTTDMLSMSNDSNKAQLEKFIRDSSRSKGVGNPTDINAGLRSAQKLLDTFNGPNEIIVLSDGTISQEGIDQTINTVVDLNSKDIKIHFVQILSNSLENKESNRILSYNILAQAAESQSIILNPSERVTILHPAFESNEPCILPTLSVTSTPAIAINETPILSSLSTPTKSPGFEMLSTVLIFFILIKLRYKI
jgi:hypothetical protein